MPLTRRQLLTSLVLLPAVAYGLSAKEEAQLSLEVLLFTQAGSKNTGPKAPPLVLPDASQSAARVELKPNGYALAGVAKALAHQGYAPLSHKLWWIQAPANSRVTVTHEDARVQLACQLQRGQTLQLDFSAWTRHEGNRGYTLNETRRVKFTETHYFDHPDWGALVQVRHPASEAT